VELRSDIAIVVQGVRRSGKSTLLRQLIDRYRLDRTRCLFVNFEDPQLAPALDHSTLQMMVDAFEADRGPGCTYLLDEIQWVSGWQRWLRGQLDRPRGRRFIVTGSNAHLLSGELGSSLTGHHHAVALFPFDFNEFRAARPAATLEDYLACGGFPAVATSPDRDMLLRGHFQDIVERDMRERVAARSTLPLRRLVQMLYESAGSEMSVRSAARRRRVSQSPSDGGRAGVRHRRSVRRGGPCTDLPPRMTPVLSLAFEQNVKDLVWNGNARGGPASIS
jgi:uncharacterized protein